MFLDLENDSMIYVNIYADIYNAIEIFIHVLIIILKE